ncbi:hypothetical protein BLNAU_17225 [Blattamonas nauphoetae]|uniref:Protein kinase domain-containing protein n=1 Tax=Blattamonas nauphoetae TaxID=2049346 RepID=A0ABQ9X9D1_9EUKA|nr:hypothetical protein BLNAU_17225 [Blattamonas nauphoetae]
MTSSNQNLFLPTGPLTQRSIGTSVTHSVGALQGTILSDFNQVGSLLCSNTSFARCTTTKSIKRDVFVHKYFEPLFSKFYSTPRSSLSYSGAEFTGSDRHRFWSHFEYLYELPYGPHEFYAPSSSPITFTQCSFTQLVQDPTDSTFLGGLAIVLHTLAPLTVVACSFTDLSVTRGAAAIVCIPWGRGLFSTLHIENSTFTRCSTTASAGALLLNAVGCHSVVSSSFSGCSSGYFGGACMTMATDFSFCTFEGNSATEQAGAVFDSNECRIQFCAFLKNEAPVDRDWYCATVVGCTRSEDDWEDGTGLVLATGSGNGDDCSLSHPCRSLESAVSKAQTIGVTTIVVGDGTVGAATLPSDFGILTVRPHVDVEEAQANTPSSSFSITSDQGSGAVLDALSLSPIPGLSLLKCGSGSQPSRLQNCRIVSVNGVSVPLFAVSDGAKLTFTTVLFENITQVSSPLISVKDFASVSLVQTFFRNIESTHCLIEIAAGGSCSVEQSLFRSITRSAGEGAAAIDVTDCESLSLQEVTFSHCVSKEGKAGAVTVTVSNPATLSFNAAFLNNRGRDENCAHDMLLTGFDPALLPTSFYSEVTSLSESPQVIDGSASPPTIDVFSNMIFYDNDVPYSFASSTHPILFLPDFTFIDLTRAISRSEWFEVSIRSRLEIPVTIPPLSIEAKQISLKGQFQSSLQPFVCPPHTNSPLFAVSDEAFISLWYFFHQLDSSITEPLISISSEGGVELGFCAFTSDGGVHSAPLVRVSSASLLVMDTSVYNIAFAACSCFECVGGSFRLVPAQYANSEVFANVTTTGDGAVLNCQNCDVELATAHFFDCHARNGGVAFFEECQIVNVSEFHATHCSAESRGGALFIHSVGEDVLIQLQPTLISCSAELGGGIFLNASHHYHLRLQHYGYSGIVLVDMAATMMSNCVAVKGGGIFIDGDWSKQRDSLFTPLSMSNGGPLICGQDMFFTKSVSESFPHFGELMENLTERSWSMSTRSSDDGSPFKQIEVEGHPEWSRNLDLPKIVLIASDSPNLPSIREKQAISSSINDYLPLLHLKDENFEYLQIPIFLQHKVFFDQTGVVREQSILLTPETSTDPVPPSTLSFGSNCRKNDRFFLRLAKEGRVEISNVAFVWEADLGLCEVVDGSGTAKMSSCNITLNVALSRPLLSCSAGTLVISQCSFTATDPSQLTVPLVCSSPLSSSASNSAADQMRIEMEEVNISNLNVDGSVDGVVQIEGADSLRLKNVDFSNVKNGASDAVRIFVMGAGLDQTIEPVRDSGFPARQSELAGLYKSLDIAEPLTSNYRSPTLLLYLNAFDGETVVVSGTEKDGMWCGEADFPCRSLNEADRHLKHALPSTIEVQTSAVLHSEQDLNHDITKIASGSGEKGRVDVSKEGCLVNQADTHTHSLTLDSLVFSLTSDRTKTLLVSRSGSLIVTGCSFTSSSKTALTSKLVEVSGGSVKITETDFTPISFSSSLLSFSSFVSVDLQSVSHKSCSPHTLMSFDGKDAASSIVEMRNCDFKGLSSSESNTESLCEWNTGLVALNNCSFVGFSSSFSHISQGALRVVDSVVTLKQNHFEVNGPRDSSFPSLNWNVGCFGKSEIELASSSSTELTSISNWISTSDECVVKRGDSSNVPHTFFIPTLSIENCSSQLEKKKKNFGVSISGSTLIPCSLGFVVEEVTDKTEGRNVTIPVSSSFTTLHNETCISLTLPESSFSQLDARVAWNAFLAFENDGRTDSFIFKQSAKEKQAQAMGKILPWLIPLIVSICALILIAVVVICLCRRRRPTDEATKMSEMKEEDAVQIEEKVEVDQGTQLGIHANEAVDPLSKHSNTDTLPENPQSSEVPVNVGLVEACRCGSKLEVTVVREQDSLYNILHVRKEKQTTIVKRVIERQLALGLDALATGSLNASILTRLTSHWVMFDSNGNVCLKLQNAQPTPSLPNQQANQAEVNVAQEAQRWKAPEVVKAEEGQISLEPAEQEVDPLRAAVFSLGLVLWEIETGSVPFAEQDATNAQRQLGTGAHPKMEGVGAKMQELIESCLALDPTERPKLSEVYSILLTLGDDDAPDDKEPHSQP